MSAIAGFFDPKQLIDYDIKLHFLKAMQAALSHRAPLGFSCSTSIDRCAMVTYGKHIAESPEQLVSRNNESVLVAYDGSLFNLPELVPHRPELTDPERLLDLLQENLPGSLAKLDGSFALAFYKANSPLVLAVDLFGDKPLYWLEHRGVVIFSSELCALQTLPFFDDTIDEGALAEFLSFQYIGAPRTLYPQVQKIPAGHWLLCREGHTPALHRYGAFTPGLSQPSGRSLGELAEELETLLIRSLKRRCAGRTSIAACLSGGMDSSTVAALACAHLDIPVDTFTIGFPELHDSEHIQARRYADVIGSRHHEHILTPDVCSFLESSGTLMDEPNGDSSCLPTYMLSSMIQQNSPITLCGDCADELFAGYARYFCTLEAFNPSQSLGQFYYTNFMLFFPPQCLQDLMGRLPASYMKRYETVCAEMSSSTWLHPLHVMRKADMENYTPGAPGPKVERMGMRHALEFRSPFMSTDVLRFAETIEPAKLLDGKVGKLPLRTLAHKYLPKNDIDKPKRGFSIPFENSWKANILKAAQNLLAPSNSKLRFAFGSDRIDTFLSQQKKHFNIHQVWTVCVLESYLCNKKNSLESMHKGSKNWYTPHLPLSTLVDNAPLKQAMHQAGVNVCFHEYYGFETAMVRPLPDVDLQVFAQPLFAPIENSLVLDWVNENNWNELRKKLPAKPVAVIDTFCFPSAIIRKRMAAIGIGQIFYQRDGNFYLLNLS